MQQSWVGGTTYPAPGLALTDHSRAPDPLPPSADGRPEVANPPGAGILTPGDTPVQARHPEFGRASITDGHPASDAVWLASSRVGRGGLRVDRVRLLQLRDELQTERVELRETLSAVEAALAGVQKLLTRSTPSDNPSTSHAPAERPSRPTLTEDEAPRGFQAVEAILVESGSWMTVKDLTERQIERGWLPGGSGDPVNAVRAAANRLVRRKPDRFVREQGRYRYQGRSETVQAQASTPPMDRQSAVTNGQAGRDWRDLARTDAVARMLAQVQEPVSPTSLSRMLEAVGRDDPPLAVGKALDHLQNQQRATTVGRGMWVLTDRDDPQATLLVPDAPGDQEKGVNDDQEMSAAVLAFTGGSQQPDRSPDEY
jgi:hypothetical protein